MTGPTFPFPVLLGDVGGTNARFALIAGPDEPMVRFPDVATADYSMFSEAMMAAAEGIGLQPRSAAVALAGPVSGDQIALTNAHWVVEPRKTIQRLNLELMVVLNDFEAQSLALPILTDADLAAIGTAPLRTATKAVIGPGTGLGAAALIYMDGAWIPVPGEGGHVDLGPITDRDLAVWPHIERHHGRVSAETLISGSGMVRLYRALCRTEAVNPHLPTPAAITAAGLSGSDAQAEETLDLFATYLGRVAGDLAMVYLARGGVYLAGGIPVRITKVLQAGLFRRAFEDKAPHHHELADMATVIVSTRDAGLAGIGAFVRQPDRYMLNLEGRIWRP